MKVPLIDYQSLFSSLPNPYIVFAADDPAFTVIAENKAHATVAGVSQGADVIGKPLLAVFPDASDTFKKSDVSDLTESLRKVIRTKKPDTLPVLRYDLKSPKGKLAERYWHVTHFPILDAGGKVTAIFQTTADITEEMNSEHKLHLAEQQLEQVLLSGLLGTWLWDVQKDIVIGDRHMAEMFGLDAAEAAAGLPIAVFTAAIHPDDRPRLQKAITAALKTGRVFAAEYRTLRPDGSIRWLMARGRIERDGKGKAVRFPGVLLDITDRKTIETNLAFLAEAGAKLNASLDYKKTLQSVAKLAVPRIADWCTIEMFDDDGRLQTVAVEHKDPAKVKWALELRRRQGPPDLTTEHGLARVLRTGEPEYYPEISDAVLVAAARTKKELALLRSLGFSSVIIVPITVDDLAVGTITLISSEQKRHYMQADLDMAREVAGRASVAMTNARLYHDAQKELAARRLLEEELRIANEKLEIRVAERTAQLEESNASLKRSNQELQDFAYVASHDLQEPLRKIQAFGNLLEDEYGDRLGDGRDYLRRMRGAAARMSALIEDILSFSRVTTKARGFTPVNLNTITGEVIGDLETRIRDTNATIRVDKLPTIEADAMQIRQLLQNLIANALKFHKPDVPPVVSLRAAIEISQSSHDKYCRLEVEDNGVGFDEKYLDRIFAVFQRLHNRDAYEGTGIGLAVCRKIVERHGGSISARSRPGKGATFVVTLPIRHKAGHTDTEKITNKSGTEEEQTDD